MKNHLNELLRYWLKTYPDEHEFIGLVEDQLLEHIKSFEHHFQQLILTYKRALALGVENELFLDDCGWLEWEKPNEEERVDVCKGNYIKLYKISDDKWLATSSLNTKGYGYSSGITLTEHAYDTRNKAIRCECLKVLSRKKKEDCDSRLIKAWQTMYESAFDTTGNLFNQGEEEDAD